MPGRTDRTDRNDATRLFIGVAIAFAILIVVGMVGFYLLSDALGSWATVTFESGIGLKNAALISFGVSFVGVVILAIVSGGDAIIGELPFTLVGFFLFFVFFWLMLAWIF